LTPERQQHAGVISQVLEDLLELRVVGRVPALLLVELENALHVENQNVVDDVPDWLLAGGEFLNLDNLLLLGAGEEAQGGQEVLGLLEPAQSRRRRMEGGGQSVVEV
jgi:hypothetical protein